MSKSALDSTAYHNYFAATERAASKITAASQALPQLPAAEIFRYVTGAEDTIRWEFQCRTKPIPAKKVGKIAFSRELLAPKPLEGNGELILVPYAPNPHDANYDELFPVLFPWPDGERIGIRAPALGRLSIVTAAKAIQEVLEGDPSALFFPFKKR